MKVRIQRATRGCDFITLPNSVLKVMGWHEGDDVYVEPVVDKQGTATHIVLEKR